MKVFCAGLPKTGTLSTNKALEILGYKSVHNDKRAWQAFWNGVITDFEACTHYAPKQYMVMDAEKYIMLIRDIDEWLDSCERWFTADNLGDDVQAAIRMSLFGVPYYNREIFEDVYRSHLAGFAAWADENEKDALFFDVREGWEPLCAFLGKKVPKKKFPHLHHNKRRKL